MVVRVLVVDDSGFFRRRVIEILDSDPLIEVVGSAENGKEAIQKVNELKPDVVTMDIEMPVLDGIKATRQIMATIPTRIIMFSSLTTEGAKSTLDALEAGALDFLPKRFEDISSDREEAKRLLCERVKQLARQTLNTHLVTSKMNSAARAPVAPAVSKDKGARATSPSSTGRRGGISLVAIGTSTGGPIALQDVLIKLPADFPVPIILVQHMPGSFTPAFAQRLNDLCNISVKEAADGDVLEPAVAYLAPGGKQMTLVKRNGVPHLSIQEAKDSETYKPSVDITFSSIARIYPNGTLAVILTGMGADGREGARALKAVGSSIWAQDESSCVIYGMPAAVVEAGLTERVLSLGDIGTSITQRV